MIRMIRMIRLSGHSFAVNRLRCPPITATAQCAAVLGWKHTRRQKNWCDTAVTDFLSCATVVPRAFHRKARSHRTITTTGGQLDGGLRVGSQWHR